MSEKKSVGFAEESYSEPPPAYDAATTPTPRSPSNAPPQPPAAPRAPLPFNHPVLVPLRNKRIILASASPRRRQLLAQIGLTNLTPHPSTLPENLPKTLSPIEYVLRTATQKCLSVYSLEISSPEEPALVLSADTVVVSSTGQILEKPRSENDHIAMLRSLCHSPGRSHMVYTAVVVMAPLASAKDPGYALESHVEETRVVFGEGISEEVIQAYVKTREGADKAGGYAIQGKGAVFVERIEGSYDNVVGLPLRATVKLIEKVVKEAEDEEGLDDDLDED